MTSRRILSIICVAAGITMPWRRAWGFSGLVAFGDSLSDVGNVYNQTIGLAPQSPPYYSGRYSNGPLWVEDLSLDQGLTAPTRSRGGGNDWAYAGTTTGTGYTTFDLFFSFPNIETQVGSFLSGHTPAADQLFVLWGGGNDFINGQTNVSIPVSNISASITTLANAGAKSFLVANLPPLGETPRFRGTSNQATMDNLSSQFNAQLATSLTNLGLSLNVNIYQLDVGGLFQSILSSPSTYGFTDVTDSALVNNTVVPNPNQYLFWDDIHPTQVGHNLLGSAASDLLDTHNWSAITPSADWNATTSWNPSAAPQARWITNLVNTTSPSAREAVVNANSSVRSVKVSGTTGLMSLRIESGATLSASQGVNVSSGGQLKLHNGVVSTPLVQLTGNSILVGSGTIVADLNQASGSTIDVGLGGTGPGQFDRIAVTGAATLAGSLGVSLVNGYVALPGSSYEVLDFGSRNGDLAISNLTGYAGLQFVKSYSANALTIMASAIPGDVNLDGRVDIQDLYQLATHWQLPGNWLAGDFNHDGIVNAGDLAMLANDWQAGVGSLDAALGTVGFADRRSIVPEPNGMIALIYAASVLTMARHRRRSP